MPRRTDPFPIEPYFRALPGCEGLLRAIAAEPDDDTHRLVLADWLDDHGEEDRAELIRLQCRLADIPDWVAWLDPEQALSRDLRLQITHYKRWLKGIAGAGFARGMAEELSIYGDWARQGAFASGKHPVRRIRVTLAAADWDRFIRELVAGLRPTELEVDVHGPLGAEQLTALVETPAFATLRRLEILARTLDLGGARVLAEAAAPELRSLALKCGLGDEGIAVLSRARGFPRLLRLGLSYNQMGREAALALATQPLCANVEHMDLAHNELGDAGLAALASSPRLRHLRTLSLRQNGIGAEGASTLARSPLLTQLTHLCLYDNEVGPGVAELCRSPRAAGLETLDLTKNAISSEGVRHLTGAPAWARLVTLRLSNNAVDDEALVALTRGQGRLEWLGLTRNQIGPAGLSGLMASCDLGGLKRLHLGDNPLGDEGARRLAACPALGKLTRIELHSCDIRAAGMLALAESPHLRSLAHIDLRHNRGIKAARAALRARYPGSGV